MQTVVKLAVVTALVVGAASSAFANCRETHHVRKLHKQQSSLSNSWIDPNDPAADGLRAMGRHGW